MKKTILSALVALSGAMLSPAHGQAIPRDEKIEAQVEEILARLTIDEKIGQMCELAIDCVTPGRGSQPDDLLAGGKLSAASLENVFTKFKVGSILNVPGGLAQTPADWAAVIRTLNDKSMKECNGVPEIYGVDQIHGASYTWGATLFPQEIAQASSFNPAIPRRVGEITAYESRACLIPWTYAPVIDLARTPLWPRMWESYGEDVLLNGIMASELTRGLQGDDPNHVGMQNMAACIKHYLAYGAPVSGKDRTPSSVTDREMFEKFFTPFRMAVEAGALSLMVNSASNNGVPFHANHKVLTEWLKEGLQWDGMIVTDWADIDNLWTREHVAENKKEAICQAINAGIDMSMDPYKTDFCTLLKELVEEGRVPMARIDDAVRRILRLKIRVGLFDRSTWDIPYDLSQDSNRKNANSQARKSAKSRKNAKPQELKSMYPDFGSDKFAKEALEMAKECQVLLKNEPTAQSPEGILPLKQGTKIFVCGPNANNFRPMSGGWSYTWQGDRTDEVCRKIGKYHTFYEALAQKFGQENVEFSEMVAYSNRGDWQADHQVPETMAETGQSTADKIQRADIIVACIGENSYCETPGNINDLNLSQNQKEMVRALARYNKPIILVLNEGRPRLITDIEPLAKAIVHTFLPSNYGGDALAELLSGDANFSARLPFTYPKHHGAFATYDYKPSENTATMNGAYNYDAKMDVLFPFGHGLSYTTVKYSDLRASVDAAEQEITFTLNVQNTGKCAVKEPVLLFMSDMVATLLPDVRRLRAFTKVELQPGESKPVTLRVRTSDLAYVGLDMNWILEAGSFRASVGGLSTIIKLEKTRKGTPYLAK